ncbi:flagellar assembly protein FliH [Paenibacillus flagellatus]|uniref:Flagellar assembly protein FliH n=1 Tax=Paenibacillus flagellatus TaxID=2211139 RepID=A0A2V5KJ47_9BACL|nr:flagellar assembly protein FliH [Paenibacillus flagellatus]PYI50367.1 flagellar assembly protein FliH [Paenibacillus flagellatus]
MSNVIKATHYIPIDDKKLIQVALPEHLLDPAPIDAGSESGEPADESIGEVEAALVEAKEQIIRDAESFAETVVAQASEEAERMRAQARDDIEEWWRQRRAEDERLTSEAREQGKQAGYAQGLEEAEAHVRRQYEQMLAEAQAIIESAVQIKHRMIQESEPFLIELSCSIAEKIIARQLTLDPQWSIELIKKVLQRRREQGIITLCVSPDQFSFVQDAREELMLAVDSQAELQIIPDPTVRDHGCVIRSSFGSIDARIDTQLDEIKKGLQQVALRNEGAPDDE